MDKEFCSRYGPVALVTGASSGIGRSFAHALAARGLSLVLAARRVERLESLAAELSDTHSIAVTVRQTDLANPSDVSALGDVFNEHDVGLLVSNAGFGLKGAFDQDDPETQSEMLAVNCLASMSLARRFVPALRRRGHGGIIFTSSVEGLIGCPYSAVYSATKAFVHALGEALWGELKPEGIDVLTLCPGATETEAAARQGLDPSSMKNVQSPDEVAQLALDNLSNGPTFVPSPYYKASFEHLLSLPREQALETMARAMKR